MSKPLCFVIMGFGEKVDLATGRTLDLDKTYRIIIKRAVEDAGLECIRADNIIHSGVIDKPMYELLHKADIVIADLSTSNPNAIYELGVRHALRPYTTIVIAEKQFKFPFDIGHLLIRPYEHLGKGIDAEEADRMRGELTKAIHTLIQKQETDSPVHTFLPQLSGKKTLDKAPNPEAVQTQAVKADEEATKLLELFKKVRSESDWKAVTVCLETLLAKRPGDVYLKQQLALAVYKGKQPDALSALLEAHTILQSLNPKQTTDPETLGLWGAVHKRLWELRGERKDLDEAIWAYEKGFYVKNDYYNGINFAFLLNVRALVSTGREAVADFVIAERVRRQVIRICEELLEKGVKDDEGNVDEEQLFWLQATLVEAFIGIGEEQKAEEVKQRMIQRKPERWMIETMDQQLDKLKQMLAAAHV